MKLVMNQAEIEAAIIDKVDSMINLNGGTSVTVELIAGRGPEGYKAEIEIESKPAEDNITPIAEDTETNKDSNKEPGDSEAIFG